MSYNIKMNLILGIYFYKFIKYFDVQIIQKDRTETTLDFMKLEKMWSTSICKLLHN